MTIINEQIQLQSQTQLPPVPPVPPVNVSTGSSVPDPFHPDELDAMLKRLHLPTIRRTYKDMSHEAENTGMSYQAYLALLCAEEVASREQTRINRSVRKARFPMLSTIDEFDFSYQPGIRRSQLGSYLGHECIAEGRNAIISGPQGTGKTHLAIGIAYRAIQNGYTARFIECDILITRLAQAAKEGRLEEALGDYIEPTVLIIDEIGYLTLPEPDAANVLYRVVNERYLTKKPMILTTNKPLGVWGQVLHDGDLAGALVDRVLARGINFELRGSSYRTRHLDMAHNGRLRANGNANGKTSSVTTVPIPNSVADNTKEKPKS